MSRKDRADEVAEVMRGLDLLRITDEEGFAEIMAMIAAAAEEMRRRKEAQQ